jgi:predicted AlkP superfamily pyrophosphatase or phosphodiesterase
MTLIAATLVLMAQARPSILNRQLLIVLDGLRPDYVRPDIMPNLYALGQRGVIFQNHHSVYPTVTRVNASSIATGTYPSGHGVMGNSVFFPAVDATRFLDTAERENLLKINESEKGRLQTATTLGEMLQRAGRKLLIVSSGSSGSAYLLNYHLAGGAILHNEFTMPESFAAEMIAKLGPNPPEATPNAAQNRRAVDAFLQIGLPKLDPSVTVLWISDPDTTAHQQGIGHPTTTDALKRVDGEVKRVLDGLAAAKQLERYDVWVTSDHGFTTGSQPANVAALLKPLTGTMPGGSPSIVLGGGAIYVRDHDRITIASIVSGLQKTNGVGAIFMPAASPSSMDGQLAGTLSFDAIRWNHVRSADILYSPDWADEQNQYGFAGITATAGRAGHGSTSMFDVHNVLIAAGPDIKQKTTISTPSANVDFVPTFLRLAGVRMPDRLDGRVLEEALLNGPDPSTMKVVPSEHTVKTADGSYALTGYFSTVESGSASYRYFNYTKVARRSTQ